MVNRHPPRAPAATDLGRVFRALADPTRRGILAQLAAGQASVAELAAPYAVSAPAISKHLRVLEAAGLLSRRRRGREHRCRLDPRPIEHAAAWIDEQRHFWESRLDALAEALAESTRRSPR